MFKVFTQIATGFIFVAFLTSAVYADQFKESNLTLPALPSYNRPTSATYKIDNLSLSGTSAASAATKKKKKYVLPNGLACLTLEAPSENLVVLDYLVRCGVSQEGSNLQGYNFLILKMLNNRISDDSEGDDVVEITGTLVDDGASADYSRLSITTSPVNYMFMLRRLCKAVSNPNFSEAELQRAREQTLNRMGEGGGTSDQLYDIEA